MKITIRTVLLTLTLLGGYLIGQAQIGKIDQHGWKLIFVTYKDENTVTEKTDKEYGEPSVAFFVKDYPYKIGQEYPKVLSMSLREGATVEKERAGAGLRASLLEFDCGRRLHRAVKWVLTDGSEVESNEPYVGAWRDIPEESPLEAMLKYACRPRTSPKK
jgi:hypothetical protein